eukprot:UN11493
MKNPNSFIFHLELIQRIIYVNDILHLSEFTTSPMPTTSPTKSPRKILL